MDSTGENWKIQVPEATALLLRDKGYRCVPRGEINVKGKGIMFTYWVLGKNESESRLTSPNICPAGIPSSTTPTSSSLHRQTSNHSSLAAVVFGIMQATKRNTPSTRKSSTLIARPPCFLLSAFHRDNQQFVMFNQLFSLSRFTRSLTRSLCLLCRV
jgi:adenylate cyclase 8